MLVLPRVGEGRNGKLVPLSTEQLNWQDGEIVFIYRVSRTLTEAELYKIAISFGEIVSVKVQNCVAKP